MQRTSKDNATAGTKNRFERVETLATSPSLTTCIFKCLSVI